MTQATPLKEAQSLHILSGGAAQGLCEALGPAFEATHACRLAGQFGAVGGMRERLLAGAPCDVMILTQPLLDAMTQQGLVLAGSARRLGVVATGVAAATGRRAAAPDVRTPEALREALLAVSTLHCPDTEQSTAGIHVMKMLRTLGIATSLDTRIQRYPGGNIAMAELARRGAAGEAENDLGITQVTEIAYTEGVRLLGLLPPPFELSTTYVAAVAAQAISRSTEHLASQWVEALSGHDSRVARAHCGFGLA